MAGMSLCSFIVLAVAHILTLPACGNRDVEDIGGTNAAVDPPSYGPGFDVIEAAKKMEDIVKAAAEMKRFKAESARKTAGIAKALGLLVDAKKRVKAAMEANHGKMAPVSAVDVLPEGFRESLKLALKEVGVGNRSGSAAKFNQMHPEQISSFVQAPGSFAEMVTRVTSAASKVESDAVVLHNMYGNRSQGKLNHMLTSLTKAAKFVQDTARTLGHHPPNSPQELSSMSKFLLEAEHNMGVTSDQLSAMKSKLAKMGQQQDAQKQSMGLLALHSNTSERVSDGHEELGEESILHQSDAKLTKKLSRKLHQLTHAGKDLASSHKQDAEAVHT